MASKTLDWQTPLYTLTGMTTNISALLDFHFWEPVFYATADSMKYKGKPGFPSETAEARGRFVGFGESVGDVLTYKILTDKTIKIIYWSDPLLKKGSLTDVSILLEGSPSRSLRL